VFTRSIGSSTVAPGTVLCHVYSLRTGPRSSLLPCVEHINVPTQYWLRQHDSLALILPNVDAWFNSSLHDMI
jgi:hypothetical protein